MQAQHATLEILKINVARFMGVFNWNRSSPKMNLIQASGRFYMPETCTKPLAKRTSL